jgi:hypothetical protein
LKKCLLEDGELQQLLHAVVNLLQIALCMLLCLCDFACILNLKFGRRLYPNNSDLFKHRFPATKSNMVSAPDRTPLMHQIVPTTRSNTPDCKVQALINQDNILYNIQVDLITIEP